MGTIKWIEICGFRAFTKPQRLDFASSLALISGPNSHGKTSITEAIEFLLCGETLRRAFLGGAKAEFEATLRNAHLPADAPVWVKAAIVGADGAVHEVERRLQKDYGAEGDCESALLVDGVAASGLSDLGIVLANPPLRTPILFQHTVRFALSASPSERARYFRAVLGIEDLELVRQEIAALRDGLQAPADPSLARLDRLASGEPLAACAADVRAAQTVEEVESALGAGIEVAGEKLELDTEGPTASLDQRAGLLLEKIAARSEGAFDRSEFRGAAPPTFDPPALSKLSAFAIAGRSVDRDVERLHRVFEATLELPEAADPSHPIDCPVCETEEALTEARLREMREELSSAGDFRASRAAATAEIGEALASLTRLERDVASVAPAAGSVDDARFEEYEARAADLLEEGKERLGRLRGPLRELTEKAKEAREAAGKALRAATALRARIDKSETIDLAELQTALALADEKLGALAAPHTRYTAAAEPLLAEMLQAVAATQDVSGFVDLAELARSPQDVFRALARLRRHVATKRDLDAAYEDVERAVGKVLDAKFKTMSGEIATWWKLLRPDEPVEFMRVDKRGTGRRFVTFKALLRPAAGLEGVERDALGVLSDSQLNALGLAAFLARIIKNGDRFVVLDDPVQAGDEEHRATFAVGVVEALLKAGVQVIVVSHEHQLSKLMHNRYEHLPMSGFAISMLTPGDGARVVATTDTAEALLQRADATLAIDNPDYRKANAGKLRDAAERVAKEILVKQRLEAGEPASIADYEGQTLGPLIAALEPFHQDSSHPGKWRTVNTMLSPGSHDADPPAANELKIALGDLKRFHKDYLRD